MADSRQDCPIGRMTKIPRTDLRPKAEDIRAQQSHPKGSGWDFVALKRWVKKQHHGPLVGWSPLPSDIGLRRTFGVCGTSRESPRKTWRLSAYSIIRLTRPLTNKQKARAFLRWRRKQKATG